MRRKSFLNRIFAACTAILFTVVTVNAHASWQCSDGAPCPPNCTMHVLTPPDQHIKAHVTAVACSHCPQPQVSASADNSLLSCKSSKSELKGANKPLASPPTISKLLLDFDRFIPVVFRSSVKLTDIYFHAGSTPRGPPPRELASYSPRGPPVLL